MFDLLLYGSHEVDLPILWQWNLPLSQLWDWPCHQRVRFQPVPRILSRSQSGSESNLGESQEVQEGSIRWLLDESPCQPFCCLLEGGCNRTRDGFGGGG